MVLLKKITIKSKGDTMERFTLPAVGAIITKTENETEYILLQERYKPHIEASTEHKLLEIPAGKIREFENIFDALRREVKEETGLNITKIYGENETLLYSNHNYEVMNFMPFACAQNLSDHYPILVFIFICHADGFLLDSSDEARNYRWTSLAELKSLLFHNPHRLYPMHVNTLKKYLHVRGNC